MRFLFCYRIGLCSLVGFYNRQNKKTLRFFIKALAVSLKCRDDNRDADTCNDDAQHNKPPFFIMICSVITERSVKGISIIIITHFNDTASAFMKNLKVFLFCLL